MSGSETSLPTSTTRSTRSCRPKRALVPLAVFCLSLLTLTDRFFPSLLWPQVPSERQPFPGERAVYEGVVAEAPRTSGAGLKFAVRDLSLEGRSLESKALLTLASLSGPIPERGDRIRFFARLKKPARYQNPGSFDYRRHLRRQGVLFTAYLDRPEDLQILQKTDPILVRIDRFRDRIRKLVRDSVPGEGGGLISALIVGDVSGLGEGAQADFRATGTSHLVAVSGQHIALVGFVAVLILLWLLKRSETILVRFSVRRLALVLSLLPIILYVLLAGGPPSAVRAALLAGLVALAAVLERPPDGISALCAAAILIGVFDPAAPFTASFQLSFLAVLGILLFRARSAPTFLRRYVMNPFWMTLGATLMTAPVVAYRFHEISLSGVLINLAAIPLAGALLIAGFAGVSTALISPAVGTLILEAVGFLSSWFLKGLHVAAEWSRGFGLVRSFYPTEGELVVAFAAVALAAWIRRRPEGLLAWRRPRAVVAGGFAAVLCLCLLGAASFSWPRRDLEIVFLDVGQGDAALALAPTGESLLVDAGGFLIPGGKARAGGFDVGREVVVPYLKRRGLKKIDVVLLSHPHPDHFGGLEGVLDAFPVGEFWWNGQGFPDESFDRLLDAVRRKGIPQKILKDGDRLAWAGSEIEVIYPERVSPARNINDNSLVVRLRFGGSNVLFAGDIEKEGEGALADLRDIRADVLKIPHHGSRTSSGVPFIDSVRPEAAVVSLAEDNLFGFPHEGVLEKYGRRGVAVYRTDRDGAVTVRLSPGPPMKSPSIRTFSSGE